MFCLYCGFIFCPNTLLVLLLFLGIVPIKVPSVPCQLTNHFNLLFSCIFFGLEWVGHSFAYVAHFVILRDVWIRTQRATILGPISLRYRYQLSPHLPNNLATTLFTNLATHLPNLATLSLHFN